MTENIHVLPRKKSTDRRAIGVRAARELRETEHAMDSALARKLALGQLLLTSRVEANFGVAVGQSVMSDLARAFSLAVEARGALASAHQGLADVAEEHGVGWRLDGPGESKPGEIPNAPKAQTQV